MVREINDYYIIPIVIEIDVEIEIEKDIVEKLSLVPVIRTVVFTLMTRNC
jgi:hypothetical protein